jgi:hypothetical protein
MNEQSIADDKIVAKIKKLLALAASSNANEAQSAMLKAQELMVMNGLSMQDVSVKESPKKEVVEGTADKRGRFPWYLYSLSIVLANNFRCYSVVTVYHESNTRGIRFIGFKNDVETTIAIYDFASPYLKGLIKSFRDRLKNKYKAGKAQLNALCNDFARGFIHGLDMKFKDQVEKQQWGLVLIKDPVVVKYHDNKHMSKGKTVAISTGKSDEAYAEGYTSGKHFEMVSGAIEQMKG